MIAAEELAVESGSEARLQPGARLGGYRLVSRLALGATAEIWLAHIIGEQGFEKAIALKTMLPDARRAPELGATFTNEAAIAAKLYHPNIVQLVDFGRAENRYYIAMEYIEGLTLRQIALRLRDLRRPFPVPLLLHVVIKVCGALHYAHELVEAGGWLGLVHGDVSPTNLIISPTGGVKLIDFGSARLLSSPGAQSPFPAGEVRYVAPERIQGLPEDRRTDVYSLGVVLYECLAGAVPYDGDEITILSRIVEAQARDPREAAPDLPAELTRITLKAMARRPDQRYSTAEQLADDLQEFLDGQYESLRRGESEPVDATLERIFKPELGRESSSVAIPVGPTDVLQTSEVSSGGTPVGISAPARGEGRDHGGGGDRFAPDGGNDDVTRPTASDPGHDLDASTAVNGHAEARGGALAPAAAPVPTAIASPPVSTRPRTVPGLGTVPVLPPGTAAAYAASVGAGAAGPPVTAPGPARAPASIFERRPPHPSGGRPAEIFGRSERPVEPGPFRPELTSSGGSIFDHAAAVRRENPFGAEPTLTHRAFDRELDSSRERFSVDVFAVRRSGLESERTNGDDRRAAVTSWVPRREPTSEPAGGGAQWEPQPLPPPESVGCFDRGLALLAAKDYLRAQAEWERACKLDPGNRLYQTNLKRLRALIEGRPQGQGGTTEIE